MLVANRQAFFRGAMFDSLMSFALVRGGHVDVTVLGGLQVGSARQFSQLMVPGKMIPGMGGAMDLVAGAKKVIVAMEHTAKGAAKILKQCTLPLTGQGIVSMIVTELAVFRVTAAGLVLTEMAPAVDLEMVKSGTEAEFSVHPTLSIMKGL